jgi:hypothetical protein
LAANLILSARGLYFPEGGAALDEHQLVRSSSAAPSSTSSLLINPPPSDASLLRQWQEELVEAIGQWEAGLDAFYVQTFTASRFIPETAQSMDLNLQPGMSVVAAIVAAQEPLNLQQLAHILGLASWQAVRDLLKPVLPMFPMNHAKRQEYIDQLGDQAYRRIVDGKEWDAVLGHAEDREASLACALSAPTPYHKSVYDWYTF